MTVSPYRSGVSESTDRTDVPAGTFQRERTDREAGKRAGPTRERRPRDDARYFVLPEGALVEGALDEGALGEVALGDCG